MTKCLIAGATLILSTSVYAVDSRDMHQAISISYGTVEAIED